LQKTRETPREARILRSGRFDLAARPEEGR
jgi:hypothetical protein